jgi:hypothetical protein
MQTLCSPEWGTGWRELFVNCFNLCRLRMFNFIKLSDHKTVSFIYPFLLYLIFMVSRFTFPLHLYTIGRTPLTSDRPVARPLPKYRTTRTHNKRTHTHTHQTFMGFEPTITASERAKTVHALDRSPTMSGHKTIRNEWKRRKLIYLFIYLSVCPSFCLPVCLSMALQSFVGPWPLFQFLNPTHSQ